MSGSDFAEVIRLDLEGTAIDGSAASGASKTSAAIDQLKKDLQGIAGATSAEQVLGKTAEAATNLAGSVGGASTALLVYGGAAASIIGSTAGLIQKTIEARSEIETFENRIATLYSRTEGWAGAVEHASHVLPGLHDIAGRTGATVDSLTTSFRQLQLLTRGSDDAVLGLTRDLTVMAKTAGYSADQLVGVIQRAALTGQLPLRGEGGRELALDLGLSGEGIQKAYQTGTLIDMLKGKTGDLTDRADGLANTWTSLGHSFGVVSDEVAGTIGKAWDPLKTVLASLRDVLQSETFKTGVEIFAKFESVVAKWSLVGVLEASVGAWKKFETGVLEPALAKLAPFADALKTARAAFADDAALLEPIHVSDPELLKRTRLGRGGFDMPDMTGIQKGLDGLIKIAEAQAAADKFFATLEREHKLAGLDGVQKSLQEIANKAEQENAKIEELYKKFNDPAGAAAAHALVNDTAAKRAAAVWAESYARQEKDAEAWSASVARDYQKVDTLTAQLASDVARINKKSSTDAIAQMQEQAAAEIAATDRIAADAKKKAEEIAALNGGRLADGTELAAALVAIEEDRAAKDLAIQTKERKDEALLLDQRTGDWSKYYEDLMQAAHDAGDYTYATARAAFQKMADAARENAVTVSEGVAAAWAGILAGVQSAGASTADFISSAYGALTSGLENALLAVESGAGDLKSVIMGVLSDLQRAFAKMVTKLVEEWLLGEQQMAAGGSGRGYLAGVVGGIGGASGIGREGVYGAGTTQYGDYVGGGNTGTGGFGSAAGGLGLTLGAAGVGAGLFANTGGSGFTQGMGMVGGAALGGGIAAIGSALLAGVAVPVIGWIAAAIGAILIAAAAIFKPNTETHVWGTQLTPQIASAASAQQASALDIYKASGLGDREGFAKDVAATLAKYKTYAAGYEVHAGSAEDVQGDIKTLLSQVLPTEMLHWLFGQKAIGGQDIAGISGGKRYGGIENESAPFVKMLEGLGVTAAKVEQIAGMIDTTGPEKFQKFLQDFVGMLSGANELQGRLSKNALEWMKELQAKADSTPLDTVKAAVGDVLATMKDVALFTGDEQVTRGKAAVDAAKQLADQAEAYLEKIRQVDVGIAKSLSGLISSIDAALVRSAAIGAGANAVDFDIEKANRRLWGVGTRGIAENIGAATNLDQVQQYASEATSLITQVFNALLSRMEALQTLEAQFGDLRRGFADPAAAFAAANPDMSPGGLAAGAIAQQREIQAAAKLTGQAQIDALSKIRDAGQQAFQGMLSLLKEIADNQKALHTSVAAQKDELLMSNMSEQDKAVFLAQKMRDLEAQISTAKNPADIAALTQQIQQYGSQYYALFKEGDPKRQEAAKYLTDVLDKMQHDADEAYSKMNKTVLDAAEAYKKNMEDANALVLGALDATALEIEKLKAYAAGLADIVHDKLMTMAQEVVDALGPLKDQLILLTSLFTDVTKTVGGSGGPHRPGGPDNQDPSYVPGVNANLDEFAGRTADASAAVDGQATSVTRLSSIIDGISGVPTAAGSGAGAPAALAAVRYYSGRNYAGTGR